MDKKHHNTPIIDEYGCNCSSPCFAESTKETRTEAERACSKGVNLWDISNIEAGTDIQIEHDVNLWNVANLEAGTDVHVPGVTDAANSGGVTDNAPYTNIAEYKMVSGTGDDDDSVVDMQGS